MSDETIIELARLLAEATRARRLAEAAAMAPTLRAEAEQRGDELEAAQAQIVGLRSRVQTLENAANALAKEVNRFQAERDEARAEVEKLRAEYDAYQTQVANECAPLRRELAELRAKLADTEASLTLQRERADHATAEMDRMQKARSQVLVGRAGDASRLEQELRVLREEVAAQNTNTARERAEYQAKIDRIMRVFAGLVDTANDHGVYADLATIRASFNTARDIARGES